MLLRARRPEHVGTSRLRDLHRQVPDPAGRGEDEDALTRLDVRGLDERLPGREPGERERAPHSTSSRPLGDPGELA